MLINSKPQLSYSFTYILDATLGAYKEVDNIVRAASYQFLYFVLLFGNKTGKSVDLFTIGACSTVTAWKEACDIVQTSLVGGLFFCVCMH